MKYPSKRSWSWAAQTMWYFPSNGPKLVLYWPVRHRRNWVALWQEYARWRAAQLYTLIWWAAVCNVPYRAYGESRGMELVRLLRLRR